MTKRIGEKSKLITIKKSKIHNKGAFAKEKIPKGTRIIEYVGEIIDKEESEKRAKKYLKNSQNHKSGGVYIFELNKTQDIDGKAWWNKAKYINHSCNPNCEAKHIKNHIWIISKKEINPGEEITYNYGYSLEQYKNHPCNCGEKNCIGYILSKEHWKRINDLN